MALDRTTHPVTRQAGFPGVVAWLASWEPRRRPRRSTWRPVEDRAVSSGLVSLM